MARGALINPTSKIVENVVVYDDGIEWTPPSGLELVPDPDSKAWIGSTWDGTDFSPMPPLPEEEPEPT